MKAVLVATIGTRDLMFQTTSGSWYNVGDDRMRDGDIIGEQAEVLCELGLGATTYRDLTQYLLEQIDIYQKRLKPVIIGKLLAEKAEDLEKIYLIGTNQSLEVPEREKDTLYTCELIKNWVEHCYGVPVEIIHLGTDSTNPANFEPMFRWWRYIWQNKIKVQPRQLMWVCLKGGVGQASEACRISGLSLYGDRIKFFEFQQNNKANKAGIPSDYTGPFLGTNYLWDRTRQQAIRLLERYDYAGIASLELLQPHLQSGSSNLAPLANLIQAGLSWNQGKFEDFLQIAKPSLTLQQKQQTEEYWWQAYEEAYLAVVRLEQNNTTEAMFHSFRSVEGLMSNWAIATFNQDIIERPNKIPTLSKSITNKYPKLREHLNKYNEIELNLWGMQRLIEVAIPLIANNQDFKMFWDNAKIQRNNLFHRIIGLTEKDVFKAWGNDIKNSDQWETRILNCLNLVTAKTFKSLGKASLFSSTHQRAKQIITEYDPEALK